MQLRKWQAESVKLALEHYQEISKHFLCLATPGAGKTVMAAEVAAKLHEQDKIDFVLCFSPSTTVSQSITYTFSKRFDEILRVLESVVFHNMDERLSIYLIEKANTLDSNMIYTSHKDIADDLVTSREVISRLLKQMEKKNLVELS